MEIDCINSDAQREHWNEVFTTQPEKFGVDPSWAAETASRLFRENGISRILELGGGQGRDTIFFARNGFNVTVVDYSEEEVCAITQSAQTQEVLDMITGLCLDVRKPLPFPDEYFDACYSHMLYCMALTMSGLEGSRAKFGEFSNLAAPTSIQFETHPILIMETARLFVMAHTRSPAT